MNRTDELSTFCTPTHRFRNWQTGQRRCDHGWQQCSGWLSGDIGAVNQPFTFVGGQTFRLSHFDTVGFGPAGCGRGWVACGIKGSSNRGTAFFDLFVGLLVSQSGDFQCQTARCSKPLYTLMHQTGFIQFCGKVISKRLRQFAQCFWWQLFGAEFD